MNERASPGHDRLRPELIAAYADDELRPELRATVEAWIAQNTARLESLLNQQQLSAANKALWSNAEPALPTDEAWDVVHARLVAAVQPTSSIHPEVAQWHVKRFVAIFAALAAALVIGLTLRPPIERTSEPQQQGETAIAPIPHIKADDPLAGYDVLPIASAVEVDVQRVMGDPGSMFAVGEAPFSGPLVLATEEDVELERSEKHPAWPTGEPITVPRPGDVPMIFAIGPR